VRGDTISVGIVLVSSTCQCYHVLAAKMAIRLQDGAEQRRRINLTQLRHNKQKRADKTAGRKHPRHNDVDIIPAGDGDPAVSEELLGIISDGNSATSSAPTETTASAEPAAVENDDVCGSCKQVAPPTKRGSRRRRIITCVECELCRVWFHTVCVGLGNNTPEAFVCETSK